MILSELLVAVACNRLVFQQVMVSGLDDAPTAPSDPAECFTAAEALLPGKLPEPKPGEPQVLVLYMRMCIVILTHAANPGCCLITKHKLTTCCTFTIYQMHGLGRCQLSCSMLLSFCRSAQPECWKLMND